MRRQTKLEVTDAARPGEMVFPYAHHEGSDAGEDLVCGKCDGVILENATLAGAYNGGATGTGRMLFACSCGAINVVPVRRITVDGIT